MQVHHFYNGLTRTTRTLLDASVGGALMSKSANEAYQLLEDINLNNCQWLSEIEMPKKLSEVHELDVFKNLAVKVLLLTKKLQSTQLQNAMANVIQGLACDFYNGPHSNTECKLGNPCGKMSVEQA